MKRTLTKNKRHSFVNDALFLNKEVKYLYYLNIDQSLCFDTWSK